LLPPNLFFAAKRCRKGRILPLAIPLKPTHDPASNQQLKYQSTTNFVEARGASSSLIYQNAKLLKLSLPPIRFNDFHGVVLCAVCTGEFHRPG
ncbi:MAG TPA: hypothetical protein VGB07_08330, partial [Blastocatellia bacterium]